MVRTPTYREKKKRNEQRKMNPKLLIYSKQASKHLNIFLSMWDSDVPAYLLDVLASLLIYINSAASLVFLV